MDGDLLYTLYENEEGYTESLEVFLPMILNKERPL